MHLSSHVSLPVGTGCQDFLAACVVRFNFQWTTLFGFFLNPKSLWLKLFFSVPPTKFIFKYYLKCFLLLFWETRLGRDAVFILLWRNRGFLETHCILKENFKLCKGELPLYLPIKRWLCYRFLGGELPCRRLTDSIYDLGNIMCTEDDLSCLMSLVAWWKHHV